MRLEHLSEHDIQELLDDSFSASVDHRRHVMVCQKCQDLLLDYKLLAAQLNTAEAGDGLSGNFTQAVMNRVAEIDERASVRRRWYVMSGIGSIAAIIVATAAALVIDLQPLLPGVKDVLMTDVSGRLGPTMTAVKSALTPSQTLGFAAAAALALSGVSLVETLLLRPLKARLGR